MIGTCPHCGAPDVRLGRMDRYRRWCDSCARQERLRQFRERMAKPHTIYALADPYDQAVRYVGETANVQRRYREHCRGETGVKVAGWVAELKEQGMFPVLLILETDVVGRMAIKREWYWTKMYLMQGAALLNFTPETRERFTSDNGLIH